MAGLMGNAARTVIALLTLYVMALHLGTAIRFPIRGSLAQIADVIFVPLFLSWMWARRAALAGPLRHLWILVLPAVFAGSLVNSVNIPASLAALAGLVYVAMLFVVVADIVESTEQLRWLLQVWMICSAVVVVLSVMAVASYWIGTFPLARRFYLYEPAALDFPRLQGTFFTPTMYLGFVHVTLAFAGMLWWLERRRWVLLAAALILVSAPLTLSHGLPSLLLTAFLIALYMGRGTGWTAVKWLLGLAFGIFFFVNVLAIVYRIYPVEVISDAGAGTTAVRVSTVPSFYFVHYEAAVAMAREHPFVGHGIGTFATRVSRYIDRPVADRTFLSNSTTSGLSRPGNDPHSTYLGALAEGGLLAFAGMVVVLLVIARRLAVGLRADRGSFRWWCVWCVTAAYAGFLVHGFTVDMLMFRHLWVLLGVGWAVARIPPAIDSPA